MEDSEIVNYMKTAGLLLPIHKRVVRAHFNMEDTSGTIILDQAGNNYHGNLVGGPTLVSVCKHPLFYYSPFVHLPQIHLVCLPKFFLLRHRLRFTFTAYGKRQTSVENFSE